MGENEVAIFDKFRFLPFDHPVWAALEEWAEEVIRR